MRGTGRSITALAAGLAIAAGGLVAAPLAANAAVVTPELAATVASNVAFGGTTSTTLSWKADSTDDTSLVTVSPAGGTGCSTEVTGSLTPTCTITGLTAGTPYVFTVRVFDKGTPDDTTATIAATPYTVPDKPTIVATTAGNGQAWIDWSAPATGGSAIIEYTATATATGKPTRTCTTTATECVLGESGSLLENGTTYSVQVTATNAGGTSQPSTAVPVVPSATSGLPAAPTAVSAIAVTGGIEVSFTPPAEVGGFDTDSFTATCTSATLGAATPITDTENAPLNPYAIVVPGATSGATYTCRVRATNENGPGPQSSASAGVTPGGTILGAPAIGSASGGSSQATVRWTAPSPATGLTSYEVSYNIGGVWSSPIDTGSTSTTYNVTGLAAGSYSFRVRAVSAGGASPWSGASAAVTVTAGSLNAPTAVSGTPGLTTVALTWTAPTGGTLTATSYQVRYSSDAGSNWNELAATGTTATTLNVTGLTAGTAYIFGVRAISGATESAWSTNSAAVSPGKPGLPTALAGTAGDARVSLTWTAPAVAAGVPAPTGYQVQYRDSSATTWSPATPLAATSASATVTGLTNGTAYVFRVRSMNGPVEGDWTAASAEVTPEAPVVLAIELTKAKRDRKGLIRIAGTATGLERGDEVNIRVRIYDRNTGGWRKARTVARVQVNADGVFRYILDDRRALRVFGKIPGELKSDSIRVPRA